jgi:hypothetical protein
MRPPSVYAKPSCPAGCPCDLLGLLHGPHRIACRLVMVLLSHHGLSAATIADLLGCDPGTVGSTSRLRTSSRQIPARDGSGVTPRRCSSCNNRCGPQPGCARRSPHTRAWTAAGIWCGQLAGRCERSAKPSSPPRRYRLTQVWTDWRDTP